MEIEDRTDDGKGAVVMVSVDGRNEVPEIKKEVKGAILDKVDLMTFMFMNERGQRIDAEKRVHQVEFDALIDRLDQKYGISMKGSLLDAVTGQITSPNTAE